MDSAPLYTQLAERIQGLVRVGTLRSGERVPSVRELARQERVSVSTVLQAYQRLEDAGVIEARPQSGYYVRSQSRLPPEPAPSRPPRRSLSVEVNELADVMLSAAQDPRHIAFGSACPSAFLFSLDRARRAIRTNTQRGRDSLGRYGLPPGVEAMRRAVARRALDWGCRIDHRNLVTTNGCMEAINLCLRAATRPGDLVALESPTYFGFLQILQTLGLRALEIPTDPRHGMSLDALERALAAHSVRVVLAMPNVSNPLGASMSDLSMRRLVEMLSARQIPLIEDAIYNDLTFGTGRSQAAKSFDRTGNVMLCSSFSKTIAPGLKGGWIEPGRWRDQVRSLKFIASGGQSEFVEGVLAELLDSGGYDRSLRQMRRVLEGQLLAARKAIAESFPVGTCVTNPVGGFVLWLELPKAVDSVRLFESCLEHGISIAPGPMFSATQQFRNCLRISVGLEWSVAVDRALREVGRLAQRQIN